MTNLTSWNIFHFPVFVLRLQKSFKQSDVSLSFIHSVFVFFFHKYIFKQTDKKTFPQPLHKARGFFVEWLWHGMTFTPVRFFINGEISTFALLIGRTIFSAMKFIVLTPYSPHSKSLRALFTVIFLNKSQ